jgi:predicted aspartyl protease
VIIIKRALCALAVALAAMIATGAWPVRAAAQDCRPERRAEIAESPMGNVPIVTVRVNGLPADLLFDTGAERTILTAAAATRLGIVAHYEYARHMRSIGSAVAGGSAKLRAFDIGGMTTRGFRVLVGSVSLPIVDGRPLDGLLGADFFDDFDVDIDLANRRVLLYAPQSCPTDAPAWGEPYTTIAANRSLHDRLFFPVALDGHRLAALIDTGAQLTALDASSAAALGVTGAELARDPVTTLRGAAAETVKSHAHRFTRLDISGQVVRDPVIMVAPLGLQDADLVLGADFLRAHRVWLSYASHLIFLGRP